VLVVSVQNTDAGPRSQGLPALEAPEEDTVGGGTEGEWEREGAIQDPGPLGRYEMQPAGAELPLAPGM
jgi:hypothetical protein